MSPLAIGRHNHIGDRKIDLRLVERRIPFGDRQIGRSALGFESGAIWRSAFVAAGDNEVRFSNIAKATRCFEKLKTTLPSVDVAELQVDHLVLCDAEPPPRLGSDHLAVMNMS
jgi:hypothetical protein